MMSISDWISIICAGVALIVTVIIAVLQIRQSNRMEYNFESCKGIEVCQLVTVIAEFVAIYGNKNIDKSYGSPGGYDGEIIETMEDLFLLALFEIYTNCVL